MAPRSQSQRDSRSLYHRWRSTNFAEVVAQDHVTRTLRNAVAGSRMVHAYLFCGPRGTGKTSTARILAKAANCLDPQGGEPCNRCPSCVAVNEGRAFDLIEIDAASNRGIDDARELREKIKFSPGESRYKVYIIDEAHMLTSEASNALLKTLEEPPEHAILILATTEAHKILPTIASRCQRFDFRRIPLQAIVEQLETICQGEGLSVQPEVLDRVARMARGSLRDAESLLDQLLAYCGERIEMASARDVLGITDEETVNQFTEALRRGDLAAGFGLVDGVASTGASLRHFSRELVDYLRALAMAKSGADTGQTREFSSERLADLRSCAELWSYPRLLSAIRAFSDLEGRMRLEPFNQLHLEIALMEVVVGTAGGGQVAQRGDDSVNPPHPVGDARGSLTAIVRPLEPAIQESPSPPPDRAMEGPQAEAPGSDILPRGPDFCPTLDLASVVREWRRIVEEVKASGNETVTMLVTRCAPMDVSGSTITLGFEREGWRNAAGRPGVRGSLEESLSRVFRTRIGVEFKYGVKISSGAPPREHDPVVEAAVRELGFRVSRVESVNADEQ